MKQFLRKVLLPFTILGTALVGKLWSSIFIIFDKNKNKPRHMGTTQTRFASLFSKYIEVTFKYNSWYPTKNTKENHWNKIVGRGSFEEKEGIKKHEQGIAWRPISKEEFEVCYYTVEDFKFKLGKVLNVKKDEPVKLQISNHLKSARPITASFGNGDKTPRPIELIVRRNGFRFYF